MPRLALPDRVITAPTFRTLTSTKPFVFHTVEAVRARDRLRSNRISLHSSRVIVWLTLAG
jgi:hypothetical protein